MNFTTAVYLPLIPPQAEVQESYLNASFSSYVEEMYEAWSYDPKSVHASWDAYFRGSSYQAPPSLGVSSKPNEVSSISVYNVNLKDFVTIYSKLFHKFLQY